MHNQVGSNVINIMSEVVKKLMKTFLMEKNNW